MPLLKNIERTLLTAVTGVVVWDGIRVQALPSDNLTGFALAGGAENRSDGKVSYTSGDKSCCSL